MVELMVVVVCYYHTVAPTGLDGFILCFYYYHTVAPTGLDGFILCLLLPATILSPLRGWSWILVPGS